MTSDYTTTFRVLEGTGTHVAVVGSDPDADDSTIGTVDNPAIQVATLDVGGLPGGTTANPMPVYFPDGLPGGGGGNIGADPIDATALASGSPLPLGDVTAATAFVDYGDSTDRTFTLTDMPDAASRGPLDIVVKITDGDGDVPIPEGVFDPFQLDPASLVLIHAWPIPGESGPTWAFTRLPYTDDPAAPEAWRTVGADGPDPEDPETDPATTLNPLWTVLDPTRPPQYRRAGGRLWLRGFVGDAAVAVGDPPAAPGTIPFTLPEGYIPATRHIATVTGLSSLSDPPAPIQVAIEGLDSDATPGTVYEQGVFAAPASVALVWGEEFSIPLD